jgi:hypothetical protein
MHMVANEINQDRRRLFGTAAMVVAATQLGMICSAAAQRKQGTNTSFGPLKQLTLASSTSLMLKLVPPLGLRSFFYTAGRTTFTALSMSRLCWRRRVTM